MASSAKSANFFPPGLSVRRVAPADNETVRSLFIAAQKELVPDGADRELRIALKKYTDSALNDDLAKASFHYSKPKRRMWVLESQRKEIVAMISVDSASAASGIALLRRLYVSPEFRRKGVAKLLSLRAEQWAQKQDFSTMRLYTTEFQPEARRLYESLGYDTTLESSYGPVAVFQMEKSLK